ncbi:MAG: YHS domain-containing (seleno)protein [Arenicellales bacterium]
MKQLSRVISSIVLVLALSAPAIAAEDPIYTSLFSSNAAGGYDVTAYFTDMKPVKGRKEFKTEYMGATWLFTSQENLDKFIQNPEKYAPQYGGYCAWAAARGDTYKGDPEHWSLYNGKLYLNFDREVKEKWLQDKETFISQADARWPALLKN